MEWMNRYFYMYGFSITSVWQIKNIFAMYTDECNPVVLFEH